jgi:spore maturation protein SpmA
MNYIWIAFFAVAFVVATVRLIWAGDTEVFPAVVNATFDSARQAFEISLGLTGVLSLWLGIMRIGERSGVVGWLARLCAPLFCRLFPGIPKGHPVTGSIFMNLTANMLGLDNAATPLGLKAMEGLQELNPRKDTASDAMIMFLVLNTSGLTLVPISIMVYRAQMGAAQPTDVFVPILLATFVSTLAGIIAVSAWQRINLLNRVTLGALGGLCLLVAGAIWALMTMERTRVDALSTTAANVFLMTLIMAFIAAGVRRKINVYETFVEGAKEGFQTAVRIIPYLVAILVGIGVFRASGAMDWLTDWLGAELQAMGLPADFGAALPTALMKPLSGSGARGLMVDAMATYGADSLTGRLACIFQGSTDTTFYILAVYFGSVGIRRTRHAVACGLLADAAGIVAAIGIGYLFFG